MKKLRHCHPMYRFSLEKSNVCALCFMPVIAYFGSLSNSHRNKTQKAFQYCFLFIAQHFTQITKMLSINEKGILHIWSQSRPNFLFDFISASSINNPLTTERQLCQDKNSRLHRLTHSLAEASGLQQLSRMSSLASAACQLLVSLAGHSRSQATVLLNHDGRG